MRFLGRWGARWLCASYCRARPKPGQRSLCRVFVDRGGGASVIPCHATGEQLRRPVSPTRAAARKAEEARETAPPLVLAARGCERRPRCYFSRPAGRVFTKGFVERAPGAPRTSTKGAARFGERRRARAPLARCLRMVYGPASSAPEPVAPTGGPRLVFRIAAPAGAVQSALGTPANDCRHALSLVDFAPELEEAAQRLAAFGLIGVDDGPFVGAYDKAAEFRDKAFLAALAARDDDDDVSTSRSTWTPRLYVRPLRSLPRASRRRRRNLSCKPNRTRRRSSPRRGAGWRRKKGGPGRREVPEG